MMQSLTTQYKKETVRLLRERFGYKNIMAVPRLHRVVVNIGFGKLAAGKTGDDLKKLQEEVASSLSLICGQKPAFTKAKTSIAGFKLRKGMPVGAKVTMRGKRMEDFLMRLIHVVLPRSRDFRGLPLSSVDQAGNMTIGMKEHIFFPEISPEKIRNMLGIEITVVTTAHSKEEGLALFRSLGFPLHKEA